VNVPYLFASDAGNILSQGEPFAACYYDSSTARKFSLRSQKGGTDVSEIATQMPQALKCQSVGRVKGCE